MWGQAQRSHELYRNSTGTPRALSWWVLNSQKARNCTASSCKVLQCLTALMGRSTKCSYFNLHPLSCPHSHCLPLQRGSPSWWPARCWCELPAAFSSVSWTCPPMCVMWDVTHTCWGCVSAPAKHYEKQSEKLLLWSHIRIQSNSKMKLAQNNHRQNMVINVNYAGCYRNVTETSSSYR